MTRPVESTPEQLEADMEATRLDHEEWLANRRRGFRPTPTLRDEYPDKYVGLKQDEAKRRAEEGA